MVALLTGCALPSPNPLEGADPSEGAVVEQAPDRFTIDPDAIPDDELVVHVGTAEDGRKFFLSDDFFVPGAAYVGLLLWNADGTFHEVQVDEIPRVDNAPFESAYPGAQGLVDARLAELGDYVIEAIEVEPFTTEVDGVTFGWGLTQDEESGAYDIHVVPGDFLAYYAPWDGLEYDM